MSDDLTRRSPEDPRKININQTWEVSYWTNLFGISENLLRNAVEIVGTQRKDVEAWLRDKGYIK